MKMTEKNIAKTKNPRTVSTKRASSPPPPNRWGKTASTVEEWRPKTQGQRKAEHRAEGTKERDRGKREEEGEGGRGREREGPWGGREGRKEEGCRSAECGRTERGRDA